MNQLNAIQAMCLFSEILYHYSTKIGEMGLKRTLLWVAAAVPQSPTRWQYGFPSLWLWQQEPPYWRSEGVVTFMCVYHLRNLVS